MIKGIDVSHHNGAIDWAKVKAAGIDFAIVRLGYGDNVESQDDRYFKQNMNGVRNVGMPYGVYIYSYAKTLDQVESEVKHTTRLVQMYGRPPVGIWWDSEDASTSACNLMNFFTYFKNQVEARTGYPVGLYTYKAFYAAHFKGLAEQTCPIWFAHYNSKADYSKQYDIHQYSSSGKVAGIPRSVGVDMNKMHRQPITAVLQVWKGLYSGGEIRKKYLSLAGYDPTEVQKWVNVYGKVADDVIAGEYSTGTERVHNLQQTGYNPYLVQQIVNIKLSEK